MKLIKAIITVTKPRFKTWSFLLMFVIFGALIMLIIPSFIVNLFVKNIDDSMTYVAGFWSLVLILYFIVWFVVEVFKDFKKYVIEIIEKYKEYKED